MPALSLFYSDGTPAKLWQCRTCGTLFSDEQVAGRHCACIACGGAPLVRGESLCAVCLLIKVDRKERERFDKALKLEEWEGPVFWENGPSGARWGDGYYESLDEFEDLLHDDDDVEVPEFVWCCKISHRFKLDVWSVIEQECAELWEGASEAVLGADYLEKVVREINSLNEGLVSYCPDYAKMVRVRVKREACR